MIKGIIGLVIVGLSFIYLMIHRNQSLMDRLFEKRKKANDSETTPQSR